MSLFQKLTETYDMLEPLAGIQREGHAILEPPAHLLRQVGLILTLDENGKLQEIVRPEERMDVLVPVSPEVEARTTGIAPAAITDRIKQLTRDDVLEVYLANLEEWYRSSHTDEMLHPILTYMSGKTLKRDLDDSGIAYKQEEYIMFRIAWANGEVQGTWESRQLMDKYLAFYLESRKEETDVDMITGEMQVKCREGTFPKKITSLKDSANAKLISSNRSKPGDFTFLGRIDNFDHALSIGFVSSAKAHSALRWLIAEYGSTIRIAKGKRTFIAWNPQGLYVPSLFGQIREENGDESEKTEEETSGGKDLRNAILGYKRNFSPEDEIVVLIMEAVTKGRYSVLYYNEFDAWEFFDRIQEFDSICRWIGYMGQEYSPSIDEINRIAFGNVMKRGERDYFGFTSAEEMSIEPYFMKRLYCSRIERYAFPLDVLTALEKKAARLAAYPRKLRGKLLTCACAVRRKCKYDRKGVLEPMALDTLNTSRSYVFGRLLAYFEKLEAETYDDEKDKDRETNAIRFQEQFLRFPFQYTEILYGHMRTAYFKKLKPGRRVYFEKLFQELMEILEENYTMKDLNMPLDGEWMFGYTAQKKEFYRRRDPEDKSEPEEA